MKVLAVYVPQSGAVNLDHGLRKGIWGFKEHARPNDFEQLKTGDIILLATGYSGGSPRTPSAEWQRHQLRTIYYGRITQPGEKSTDPEWPDEPDLPADERYVWRIKFDPASVRTISDVRINDSSILSGNLAEELRKSVRYGKGYVTMPEEFPGMSQERVRRFWVEKCHVHGRPDRQTGENALGQAVWSPQEAEDGKKIYEAMKEVRPGDIIFHFIDNEALTGFSTAATSVESFIGVEGTRWAGRPAYRVPLKSHVELHPPIGRDEFLQDPQYQSRLKRLRETHTNLFFNRELNLNQGSYLTEAPIELVQIWNDIYLRKTGKPLNEDWNIPKLEPEQAQSTSTNYWWLNANPNVWDFNELPVGQRDTYSSHNESGNKRRIYSYFEQAKPGDIVVGYVTSPDREITAICEITRGLHRGKDGDEIEFKKIEQLDAPISYQRLRENPELAKSEPLSSNHQGSLFKLTKHEYEIIRNLIDKPDPLMDIPPQPEIAAKPYDLAEAMKGLFLKESQFRDMLDALKENKNIVLQGAPGVGKTFVARRLAYAFMGLIDPNRVEMIQFHQSYSYEDFIQGFRPTELGHFDLKFGLFYQFCRRAQRGESSKKPYVFIIDEINRGNLSKIFGELMMLIEPDKRGKENAIPLAYSRDADEKFYIPENLYLIGTMNTADRSLAMVDYALRRRFRFITLKPEFSSSKFREFLLGAHVDSGLVTRIVNRMEARNEAIASDIKNLGPGYQIGHSYFCPRNGVTPDARWYERVIESEIVPLIQEYWIDNEEKVQEQRSALLA